MKHTLLILAALLLVPLAGLDAAEPSVSDGLPPKKDLPLPGEVFSVAGRPAFLIPAKTDAAGKLKGWVWYAPTLPGLPGQEERWMFERFRDAGIAVAGIDVGESYGSPAGRRLFTALYEEMTGSRGYSHKPVLLGRSRGGLMTLSWAAENADKVGGFTGIYPVCNIASYPGVAQAAGAYEMQAAELQAHLAEHNPIDRLAALASGGVPLFAIHGDVDTVVPLDDNSGLIKKRYTALGGNMELIVPKGQGHNMWSGFFQCQELVNFVLAHAGAVDGPPQDICRLLGGRSDRGFVGRPGNLYAEVGGGSRLIYMAEDLSVKSKLLQGAVVEWRPDYVHLQPGPLAGPDGQAAEGLTADKYCWIGPRDTLLVEHVLRSSAATEQQVRLTFDLQGVAEVKSMDGRLGFQVTGGFPRSVLPQFGGVLAATHRITYTNGLVQMDIVVPAGQSVGCVVALAVGPATGDVAAAASAACRVDARQESTRYWNQTLTQAIPRFACSDPYLEKLYYFRWWSLLTKLNIGGFGRWSKPLAREGTVGFNSLITYSGAPNTIDLRWLRSPDWAYGNVQSFYDNLNEGKLANHIYPDRLDGDVGNRAPGLKGPPIDFPYHNFLVKALADVYALHPDKERLRQLWPALQQASSLYDNELDADHDGLYETYPWSNITGEEWGARFLYFHPFDRLLTYDRKWRPKNDEDATQTADKIERGVVLRPGLKLARTAGEMNSQVERDVHYRQETVDENCYAYADMKGMAAIADVLGENSARDRWLAAAEKTRNEILARLWDPETGFFYDRDGETKERSLVKSPTAFYPFWAGIGAKEHLPAFKHLFNPAEFWTPYPVPTISMDYPKLAELRTLGWTYWNWNNWPMTTCHVVDAAARAAKDLDASLTPNAAELLMKYTKVHFISGDLQRPCVSEYFDPMTGQPNAPNLDYAHSYFIDLVLRHVAGIEASPLTNAVRIHPLDLGLKRFEAANVRVKGHDLGVRWQDGSLTVTVDGRVAATQPNLAPLTLPLDGP